MSSPFRAADSGTGQTVGDAAAREAHQRLAADSSSNQSGKPASVPVPKTEWTVAVDLTANQWQSSDGGGARNQSERLQELAAQSKGSSVALVVQVAVALDAEASGAKASLRPPDAQPGHSAPEASSPSAAPSGGDKPSKMEGKSGDAGGDPASASLHEAVSVPVVKPVIERYLIRDGQITKIGNTQPSRGMGQDLTDLLQVANRIAPGKKIGLITQSHGDASRGLEGDTGSVSLSGVSQAIRTGLGGSGHDKLDLVDFDACSMASVRVTEAMTPVARQMVASSEEEFSSPHAEFDAQNIQATLKNLFAHPTMSASEFGQQMVKQANAGINDGFNSSTGRSESGTPTLGHYDLSQTAAFNSSLSRFGNALAEASRNPEQMQAINDAIGAAPILPVQHMSVSGHPTETRDLQTFANRILAATDRGLLHSPALQAAARDLLEAQKKLVPDYHGQGDYSNQGGLTAFLPDLNIRNTANPDVGPNLGLSQIEGAAEMGMERGGDIRRRDLILNAIDDNIKNIRQLLGTGHASDLGQLQRDRQAIASSQNLQEYQADLARIKQDSINYSNGSFGRDLVRAANIQSRDRTFRDETLSGIPGWQRFMSTLRTTG